MIRRDEVYKIGKLGKPHGVKGEITFAITDDVFDRVDAEYLVLDIDGILVPFYLEEYRFKNDENVLVKFEDIDTQEQARNYTGCEVFFPRHLSDSDEENMSWAEIIGFHLVDAVSGKVVGTIEHVDDSTLNLLFEVTTDAGDEILIPASNDLIEEVSAEKKEIRMAIPEGLLELQMKKYEETTDMYSRFYGKYRYTGA